MKVLQLLSTLCLEHLNSQHVVQALSEIYRVAKICFLKLQQLMIVMTVGK